MKQLLQSQTPLVDHDHLRLRVRLVLWLNIGLVVVFAVSDPLVQPALYRSLWALKAAALVVYVGGVVVVGRTQLRGVTTAMGVFAVIVAAWVSSISGVLVDDEATTAMLCSAGLLTTAIAVPWGWIAQSIAAAGAALALITNALLLGHIEYAAIGGMAILFLSVVVAQIFQRQMNTEILAKRAVEDSERFVRKLTDQLPALIAYLDADLRYQFVNEAMVRWSRLSRPELEGRHFADLAAPEVYAEASPHLQRALGGGSATFDLEVPSPTDELRTLTHRVEPDIDEHGRVVGLFCLGTDITDQKSAEERMQQHHSELAHVLRVSTMGEMAATLAHEVNQPLLAIAAYAESCLTRIPPDMPDAAGLREAASHVADEAMRAGEIIHRLQMLVRRSEPTYEPVDVNQLVRNVAALIGKQIKQARAALRLELADDLPAALADGIQIEQVLVNLLLNAAQAIERSAAASGTITATTSTNPDGTIGVRVADSGPGIHDLTEEQIFEPYFSTREAGLGMGLAICRSILELHGGRIWHEPGPKGGACFCITLRPAGQDGATVRSGAVVG